MTREQIAQTEAEGKYPEHPPVLAVDIRERKAYISGYLSGHKSATKEAREMAIGFAEYCERRYYQDVVDGKVKTGEWFDAWNHGGSSPKTTEQLYSEYINTLNK